MEASGSAQAQLVHHFKRVQKYSHNTTAGLCKQETTPQRQALSDGLPHHMATQ